MKRLDELEVSPMPWREASYGLIVSADNKKVADFCGSNYDPTGPDFLMMEAAPKLYEALYDLIRVARNRMPSQPTLEEIEVLRNAEAAIAEAAGESGVVK